MQKFIHSHSSLCFLLCPVPPPCFASAMPTTNVRYDCLFSELSDKIAIHKISQWIWVFRQAYQTTHASGQRNIRWFSTHWLQIVCLQIGHSIKWGMASPVFPQQLQIRPPLTLPPTRLQRAWSLLSTFGICDTQAPGLPLTGPSRSSGSTPASLAKPAWIRGVPANAGKPLLSSESSLEPAEIIDYVQAHFI